MFQIFSFKTANKKILSLFLLIISLGLYSFLSASFGILNRNEIKFYGMLESQFMAYAIGLLFVFITYFLYSKFLYKLSPFIYILGLFISSLTFLSDLGLSHGGATRWINFFGFSLQPAEILKLASIFWVAYFFKKYGSDLISNIKYLFLFFLSVSPIIFIFFLQKDLGSLLIVFGIIFLMYFVSNFSRVSHIIIILMSILLIFIMYVYLNPYARSRVETLINPDPNSSSYYQTEQAYIAISGGGVYGKGIFSGIQKYKYLPEPAGDSIFATFAEETGFIFSSALVIILFSTFIYTAFISKNLDDVFEGLVVFGISMHFLLQIVMNIGSMLGVIPLSGDTLPLFSQGGTSIIINFIELAIILNFTKTKQEDFIV